MKLRFTSTCIYLHQIALENVQSCILAFFFIHQRKNVNSLKITQTVLFFGQN